METGRTRRRWKAASTLPLRHLAVAGAALALLTWTAAPRHAAASGEARTLSFFHTHTKETATVTFRRDGGYDDAALTQLNWLLRDWRVDEPSKMDPRLFDILWEVYRESGSREPIHIVSAYRSPATNGMLRQRSRAVSEHSQHMSGKAMDIRLPDVDAARLRAIAMRLQHGGVGYYGSSGFIHLDTGSVRAWPRMSEEQLAQLFPDGKTVHLPPSGKPLAGYEAARAEIAARNASGAGPIYAGIGTGPSLLSFLGRVFGSGEAPEPAAAPAAPAQAATPEPLLPAAAPLPPRRPAGAPIQVADGAPPAAPLPDAPPAAMRPEMEWPAPEDHRATARALFTALAGGAASRPAPRIVMARAQPRPFAPGDALGGFGPPAGVAARFVRPAGGLEQAHFTGPAVQPVQRIREAKAGS
jgi:uncharacterized protein YcbK (DUF882 family)